MGFRITAIHPRKHPSDDLYLIADLLPRGVILALPSRISHTVGTRMKSSENSLSVWKDTSVQPTFAALQADTTADVCIIGAGISGLTTAYLLARAGKSVVVVDRMGIGGGETGQTTAHLASEMDDYFYEIERKHGERGARIAYESHHNAIAFIERVVQEEGIDCAFRRLDGFLFLGRGETEKMLADEAAAALRAGFPSVERLPSLPFDFWRSPPCIRFPDQGEFHPLRYINGLAKAIVANGGRIYTDTEVVGHPTGGSPVRIETQSGAIVTATKALIATNYPISSWLGVVPKLAPYRTYVVGFEVPSGSIPHGLYWDTEEPYHYVRLSEGPRSGTETLIVGGEDHKTGQAEDMDARFQALISWTRERFLPAGEVVYKWSGQVQEPVDLMAFIGPHPGQENLYVITGDSGQGMTHGTLGGILVSDLMLDRENPWLELYDPGRSGLSAPLEMAKENLNAVSHFKDLLVRQDVGSLVEIAPGEGAVVHEGIIPVAVYRDEAGSVHRCSAVCTHMGCVVRWNKLEKSWDCPCHGSRFDAFGAVLTGPATKPLHPIEK
mgnify:CR=1 FL=1